MRPSTALKKAFEHSQKINELLSPVSKKLAEILCDESTHITIQPNDGLVIAYKDGMNNSALAFLPEIEKLLNMDKKQLLNELDKACI